MYLITAIYLLVHVQTSSGRVFKSNVVPRQKSSGAAATTVATTAAATTTSATTTATTTTAATAATTATPVGLYPCPLHSHNNNMYIFEL